MNQIAVLITCHNRKEKTLHCLQNLYKQSITCDVYLVDDGSIDGTSLAVKSYFPDVNIIQGNGELYWNRGMFTAWSVAEKIDYEYYLWLNDDTYLFPDTLSMMLECSNLQKNKALIVGASCSPDNHNLTTFGADYKKKALHPNGTLQECDAFGGNCVLIPRIIYKKCGKLDYYYRHSLGDIDYAKNVIKYHFPIYLAPKYTGECVNDSNVIVEKNSLKAFYKRCKMLYHPLGYSNPLEFFHYYRKYEGLFSAIIHFLAIHYHVIFPLSHKRQ